MVAAVALFAAVSCNKELPQEEVPAVGETVVYTASTDGADTKAVLNETTKKSEWVADDAITVHDGENGWTFTAAEAGANVDFSNSEGFGEYRPVLAVYPAGTYTVDVAAKTAKANIPTWQQAQAGTYHSPAALAVAYSEDNTFAFKNAHALLKFTVNTDNVTHVIFHGNGSEAITGDVNVTLGEDGVESVECLETVFTSEKWNDETQQNEQVSETKYGTWVECYAYHDDANKYFAKGQTYYIAVAPQTFEGGVTVRVRINDGEELVAKTTTNPVETKINTILNLGEIKYEAPATVEKVYLQPGVWSADNAWFSAHFFNSVGGAEDVKMTDDDADGVYEVSVPAGMESVIFCRMNPEYTEFGWDVWEGETEVENHVWNQTGDLVLPLAGDTKVYYNVTDWEAGEWSDTPQENTPDQPEVDASAYGLVGSFQGWNVASPIEMTNSKDGWIVAENVELYKVDEFKFVKDKSWDVSYGTSSVTVIEEGQEFAVQTDNSQNMKVSKNGKFNLYFNPATLKVKVECVDEYTNLTVDITIDNKANWSPLYIYLEADGVAITPAEGALVSNNVYAVSGDYIGSTLTCKFISGSKASEVMNVAITKNGATVTLEETIIKLKIQLDTDNAKKWWGNTMKIHVWSTGTSFDTSWPGNTMTSEGNYTWSIIVPSELVGKTINYLVHNGNGWQSSDSTVTISAEGKTVDAKTIGIN